MTQPQQTTQDGNASHKPVYTKKRTPLVFAGRLTGGAVVASWLISVFYHAVLFIAMALVPWLSGFVNSKADYAPFTAIVGEVDQPTVTLESSNAPDTTSRTDSSKSLKFEPTDFKPLSRATPVKRESLDIIGVGTPSLGKGGFSLPGFTKGPEFFGLGSSARGARKIVYVVDRSGSMILTLKGVISELRESIGGLRRSQKFHVIFYNSGSPLENPPQRLVSAIQAHKRNAYEFFSKIQPSGGTDPRPALRRAFAVKPDLIYFLSDGDFQEHNAGVLKLLKRLNGDKHVRIYTLAYVSQAGAAILERIAREHNGEFRFVSENEIY